MLFDGGNLRRVFGRGLIGLAGLGIVLARGGELLLHFLERGLRLVPRHGLLRRGQGKQGRVGGQIGVLALIEQGEEAVVIDLGDRIVLVRVTLGAADGEAHPDLHRRVHAILHRGHAEFLVVRAAFVIGHRVAMKGGGDLLILGRIRQQIAGELFDGELVERHVLVQGIDHPVAIQPDVAPQVLLIAAGVGIACEVEPQARPVLAEARGVEQRIDKAVECRGGESLGLRGRGRQAGEVQRQAPGQRGEVRTRGRGEVVLLQFDSHQGIDRAWHDALERFESPVLAPCRALVDPGLDQLLLLLGQRAVRLRRRHHIVFIRRDEPGPDIAVG